MHVTWSKQCRAAVQFPQLQFTSLFSAEICFRKLVDTMSDSRFLFVIFGLAINQIYVDVVVRSDMQQR